jgi:hypothetical protein
VTPPSYAISSSAKQVLDWQIKQFGINIEICPFPESNCLMKNPPDRPWLKLIDLAAAIVILVILVAFTYFHGVNPNSAYQMLLIWSADWLSATALVALIVSRLLKSQHAFLAQTICMIAVGFNLILIFSVCPMDLLNPPDEIEHPPGLNPDSTAAKFLIEENKKAVEEIKSRDEEEDTWFHNKFILVGGLLAATIGFGLQRSRKSTEDQLTALSESPATAVILALASVLALGIDMHVRGNTCEVSQLGLWIRYYVEPVMLHGNYDDGEAKSLQTKNFKGWEEFLRTEDKHPPSRSAVYWEESRGTGKHSGELWNFFYEPHTHFLTGIVYFLYLAFFQTFALNPKAGGGFSRRSVPIISFAVVQASFFAFAWIAHSAPEMFKLKVLPFVPADEAGYVAPLHYFVPCLALILLNIPYVFYYWRKGPNVKAEPNQKQIEAG